MPTALITGVTGFTGRYLTADLKEKGYDVVGLTHSRSQSGEGMIMCDLLDRTAVAEVVSKVQPDVVAHLAAIAFVAHKDVDALYRTNVVGTRNLLEALCESRNPPSAVLLASSANVYGNAVVDPISEEVQPQPANDYAVSKLAMEYMASLWFERLPITIARPFNYTGVGQSTDFLIPKIVEHFRQGKHVIELGNLDVERDFSDVRAVARAYLRLLEVAPVGETVNVCSGRIHSLREVIEMAEVITGHKVRVEVNPAFVRANEIKTLRGDPSKLCGLIGAWKTPPLEETLRWMLSATDLS
ncbi:MAG: GDP-mannose 4,6-dehydratase [Gammaproteobacteria bacterium]|nr:GDP-mannose 4,6-dehydratase [Gammaproteobacteria bacterium]